jgi:hypothetical protein
MCNQALLKTILILLGSFMLLSYNDDPPNGRTGAPFDGHCNDCHANNNPGGYNGYGEIIGLPDTIQPGITYALQLRATKTAGNPVRAGFQLVVVDKNNQNAGDLSSSNSATDTEFLDGREYLDHRSGKFFSGPVQWDFKWTAPANSACNTIKFYYIINFCNGSGDFGDYSIAFADSVYFNGPPELMAMASTVQHNTCLEDLQGIALAQASGGASQYTYVWSNGSPQAVITGLANGTYTVTVQDSEGCKKTATTSVNAYDTLAPQLVCPGSLAVCAQDTVHFEWPTLSDNCSIDDALIVLLMLFDLQHYLP